MIPGSGLVPTERRFELLLAGLLTAGVVGVTAFLGSIVVAAMTLTGVLAPGASLWVLLALLVTVLGAGLSAAGATAWLAWIALGQLRAAVAAGHRRLLWNTYRRARSFEERNLLGRLLRPARMFESRSGREGPLVTELKARYVAGELDEFEFERELGRLLGGGAEVGRQVRREIAVTAPDGGEDDDSEPERATGRERVYERERERESERE